jgi:hypothetical protein
MASQQLRVAESIAELWLYTVFFGFYLDVYLYLLCVVVVVVVRACVFV